MLFNSTQFGLFLVIVFSLYWLIKKERVQLQNILILVSSYVFYGFWDWRFLFLIFFSSIVDYSVGYTMSQVNSQTKRKLLLLLSVLVNIGFLGFFKYYNFFADSLHQLLSSFGLQTNPYSLSIILPVGISFYTFQTLSYTIDIYKRKLEPTKDIIAFFAFVSFFPQLVAGPIERASHLLPQFMKERKFNYERAVKGLKLILWGLFKKVVIADNCAEVANYTFGNYENLQGSLLFFGAVCFAFQIYCDFSGYSDIAIGTARLFGFDLMRNFAFPYFADNIREFWHRWHISLSTWFRDYVYIPLGGSYGSLLGRMRNILLTFTISGLWHGANWTFIAWGAIHGLMYLPNMILTHFITIPKVQSKFWQPVTSVVKVFSTFFIVTLAWVFFRADSLKDAFEYLGGMLSPSLFSGHAYDDRVLLLILPFVFVEFLQRKKEIVLEFNIPYRFVRWLLYLTVSVYVFIHWGKEVEFIYFQF